MARRGTKRHKKFFLAVLVLLVIVIAVCACLYFFVFKEEVDDFLFSHFGDQASEGGTGHKGGSQDDGGTQVGEGGTGHKGGSQDDGGTQVGEGALTEISSAELSIHFLELGNKYTGDCTLIKVGDTEVLIDAGSRKDSAGAIVEYVSRYCTDNTLEYVIATHAHQDHIAGFVGSASVPGVLESFSIGTIIDFPLTNAKTNIYEEYLEERENAVERGAEHYTALECWNNEGGAQRSYALSESVTMNILYQRFYEETTGDENDYSVCMLLTQGENNYLFTGDLEGDGEQSLVESNELPRCKLFKGGHHGSYTASTDALLSVIQPEIVCVCCCAGSPEYTINYDNMFPAQAFIDRVGQYTDQIYVTSLATDVVAIPKEESETNREVKSWEYTSMNGNIVVYTVQEADTYALKLWCSNNTTKLKDTDWFRENRTWKGV